MDTRYEQYSIRDEKDAFTFSDGEEVMIEDLSDDEASVEIEIRRARRPSELGLDAQFLSGLEPAGMVCNQNSGLNPAVVAKQRKLAALQSQLDDEDDSKYFTHKEKQHANTPICSCTIM